MVKFFLELAFFCAKLKAASLAAKNVFFAILKEKQGEQCVSPQFIFEKALGEARLRRDEGKGKKEEASVAPVFSPTAEPAAEPVSAAEPTVLMGVSRREDVRGKKEETPSLSETAFHFIKEHYETRYNVLDQRAEIRERGSRAAFRPFDELTRNTIVLQLHNQGCKLWDKDVSRILKSLFIKQYHPFKAYFDGLPEWDGVPRVDELARRVSMDRLWVKTFHRWMLGLAAQWSGLTDGCTSTGGNQMVPLLVSTRQGLRKSTFCRMLVPQELRSYYIDKFDLAGATNMEVALARFGLINLDEFDRYSERQMAKLKNLIQLGAMAGRRPYASSYSQMDRLASFIGTSNSVDLLSDPTGSRRFFCQEVTDAIDCDTPIDYAQLYAELLHELKEGARTYFTKEEEILIQQHNQLFYRASTLREVFAKLFEVGNPVSDDGEWMCTSAIYMELGKKYGSMVSRETVVQLGRQLTMLEVPSRHSRWGTEYYVVRRNM